MSERLLQLARRIRAECDELVQVLDRIQKGWQAADAKSGTYGKVMVFSYEAEWEGQFYPEKEVTVYYKLVENERVILLTVKARYGQDFPRR